jgi:hypothetical protein
VRGREAKNENEEHENNWENELSSKESY